MRYDLLISLASRRRGSRDRRADQRLRHSAGARGSARSVDGGDRLGGVGGVVWGGGGGADADLAVASVVTTIARSRTRRGLGPDDAAKPRRSSRRQAT
jgi:hypothetical protein